MSARNTHKKESTMNTKLNQRCLLVSTCISIATKNKQDRAITEEVLRQHSASHDAGKFVKNLYPEEAVKPVQKQAGVIRQLVYARSLPWSQDGQRMLPCAALLDLQSELNKEVTEFNRLADESAANFDNWIATARITRNGMFNRDDYPATPEQFRRLFNVDVKFLPMPDESHVVLDMANEEIEMVKESTARQVKDAVANAQHDLFERVKAPLQAMADTLRQDGKVFRDSLIGNVKDIADVLPALNIMGDAKLTEVHGELQALGKSSAGACRRSRTYRKTTADKAQAILAKL